MAIRALSQTIKALEARIENPQYGDLDCDILDYLQELDKMKKRSISVPSSLVQKVTDQYSVNVHDKIYEYGSCGTCGAPVIKPDKYCSECGAKLNWG